MLSKRNNHRDNKCRLCKAAVEDIVHITSSCPLMSSRFYLPFRHDIVAKELYKRHIKKFTNTVIDTNKLPHETIHKFGDFEYWWNVPILTATKLRNNKPDIVIWNIKEKICYVLEISCPTDTNIERKTGEKIDIYGPLIRNLQMMYGDYKFQMCPIIIGGLGYVSKDLTQYLTDAGFDDVKNLIRKLQSLTVSGTVKIVKTFLGFKI